MRPRLLISIAIASIVVVVGIATMFIVSERGENTRLGKWLNNSISQIAGTENDTVVSVTPTHIQAQYDKPPRFCNTPSIKSVKSGNWSDPAVWSTGQAPGNDAKILIETGTTVTLDSQLINKMDCVEIQGKLVFSPTTNTRLLVNNIQVMPKGTLTALVTNPAYTAELIIRDTPLDLKRDPQQFGQSLLGFGEVKLEGAKKDPTFIRLATEPKANDNTLTLATAPNGWRIGDKLIVPDSRQLHPGDFKLISRNGPRTTTPLEVRTEEALITGINGPTITINKPLSYDHPGARDLDGKLDFLPHVGNLTRNVTIRSENPNGTRGHVMMFGRANVNVQNVTIKDMGRTTEKPLASTTFKADGTVEKLGTNQIGRYMLHLHHTWGTSVPDPSGYQFKIIGNAVDSGRRWGIAIHGSHHGLIKDNVVYNVPGAAFVTEDGSESHNLFEHNFALGITGSGAGSRSRSGTDVAHEGTCFWTRASNNTFKDNVAASCILGFNFFNGTGAVKGMIPTGPGMDPRVNGKGATTAREQIGNEIYGVTDGAELWEGPHRFTNTSAWNIHHAVFTEAGAQRATPTFKGLTILLSYDPAKDYAPKNAAEVEYYRMRRYGYAFFPACSYWRQTVVEDANIQGVSTVFPCSPPFALSTTAPALTVRNTYVRSYNTAFQLNHRAGSDGNYPQKILFEKVEIAGISARPLQTIEWWDNMMGISAFKTVSPNQFLVYKHQGSDQNFQLFSKGQYPDFVYPPIRDTKNNVIEGLGVCPAASTNTQCKALTGLSVGGQIAPCADGKCTAEEAAAKALGMINVAIIPFTGSAPSPTPTPTPPPTPTPTPTKTPTVTPTPGPTGTPYPTTTPTNSPTASPTPVATSAPTLTIHSPVSGGTSQGSTMNISFTKGGNLTDVRYISFRLDLSTTRNYHGSESTYDFINVPAGSHTLTGYLVNSKGNVIATSNTVTFTATN